MMYCTGAEPVGIDWSEQDEEEKEAQAGDREGEDAAHQENYYIMR